MAVVRVRWLPRWAPMAGWSFAGCIWIRRGVRNPAGIIEHESVHLAQQERDGIWRWHLRYVFRPSWRVRYEVEAYRVDVAAGRWTPEEAADLISSVLYLWPCSYAKALALLT